jgi:predicted ATP-grasp superfamily ATP-dependent carboligase
VIIGASARAAAFSARRAGLRPLAADRFADHDLRQIAPVQRVPRAGYPGCLAAVAAALPEGPWIYTGSLENHPELVSRMARQRPLWGNDGPILRAIRDPWALAASVRRAGFSSPAVRYTPEGLPRDGSWLVKPLASGGGEGVRLLGAPPEPDGAVKRACYYQERIAGPSLAAVFVAARSGSGTPAGACLLGITRQWIGRPGSPFAYVGSIGPWPVSLRAWERIEGLGQMIAAEFGLIGLFGIDLILRDDEPWPVEVNPRYTASVEVLELAQRRSLLAEHARACDPAAEAYLGPAPPLAPAPGPSDTVGKLIVFALTRCRFGFQGRVRLFPPGDDDPFAIPRAGDIPEHDTVFKPGDPVLTLFARGASSAACRAELEVRRGRWEQWLRRCATGS